MSKRLSIVHGIALGLLALAPLTAHADWLVTHEGGRVETKGPWQMKGKLVVFTRADDGALASLRASEVNLDASAKATADAKVQATAPPPPVVPQKKLAVLTDKDFRKPTPAATPDGAPAAAAHAGPLVVSDWKRVDSPSGDGIAVEGSIHNTTAEVMINASVEVQLYNEVGDRVGTGSGLLTSTSIKADGTVSFRASFPGVFTFASARFEVNGFPINVASPDPRPADGASPP
jgi:hypothetical protein